MAAPPVVSIDDVTVIREGNRVLDRVSWTIRPGERWVLFGPNGSGKTSMLQVASCYRLPTRGRVHALGHQVGRVDLRQLRTRIGYVGSEPAALVHQSFRAIDIIVSGKHASFVATRFHDYSESDWDHARACLDRLQGGELAERTFATLSEGEKKRVLIARSLVTDPELLLLDEPASSLDLGARERLIGSLSALARTPAAPPIVMVTHHLEEIPPGFDRILVMSGGRVLTSGRVSEVLTESLLSEAFGLPLEMEQRDGRWRAWAKTGTDLGAGGMTAGLG